MRNTRRFEIKYRLSFNQYLSFKNAIVPYLERDYYTRIAPADGYLVRSLYFDTFDLKAYREKEEGDFGRIKLRLRTYGDDPLDPGPVSVEIKTKSGTYMEKFATFVPFPQCEDFMESYHWTDLKNPVMEEFERLIHVRRLRPVLLVQYRRQGFNPRDGKGYRITLDRHMEVGGAKEIFPGHLILKRYYPENIVLEIKINEERPGWLVNIVRDLNLKIIPNSKFGQGIETITGVNNGEVW